MVAAVVCHIPQCGNRDNGRQTWREWRRVSLAETFTLIYYMLLYIAIAPFVIAGLLIYLLYWGRKR